MAELEKFDAIELESIPAFSVTVLPVEERRLCIAGLLRSPEPVFSLLGDPKTGSFTRGLTKNYGLPVEKSAVIALFILKVFVGEVKQNEMASVLSKELPLDGEKAQRMAKEIERDLLAPVREDLEKFWQEQRRSGADRPIKTAKYEPARPSNVNNILDLKKNKRPPLPPMPR